MDTSVSYVSIIDCHEQGCEPAGIIPFDSQKTWQVLHCNKRNSHFHWVSCDSGDVVRIPLIPFCSLGRDPLTALAKAFEMGLSFGFMQHHPVSRLHLCIGVPLETLNSYLDTEGGTADCMRFWLGVALQH